MRLLGAEALESVRRATDNMDLKVIGHGRRVAPGKWMIWSLAYPSFGPRIYAVLEEATGIRDPDEPFTMGCQMGEPSARSHSQS
jgi:hypothetical protein